MKTNNLLDIVVREANDISCEETRELNEITSICFGKKVPLKETMKQFEEAELLSLLMENGEIKGYGLNSAISLNESVVNYFGSGFIDPQLHDRDVYVRLNLFRANLLPTNIIMTRTQNPKVYSGFKRLCREKGLSFSPNSQGKVEKNSLELAKAFSVHGGGAFDKACDEEQICRGVYGRELMRDTPLPNETSKRVMSKLDVSQGDAIILVGRVYN